MAYIIRRTDRGGGYVAPSGNPSSYVKDPRNARQFATWELAGRELCEGNEVVVEYHPDSLRHA